MSMTKYMQPRNTRREVRTLAGKFKGGKLVPIMAVPFRESEGGLIKQRLSFELDPIAGRMITPMTIEIQSVFVPTLAIDVMANMADPHSGNAEIFREKLLSGNEIFFTEVEGPVTKQMGIVPRSINGEKRVNRAARLAHISAVNYLRRLKYVKADQLQAGHNSISPALIGQTVLDRLGAVLNPEDRVNGRVQLGLNETQALVKGIGRLAGNAPTPDASVGVREGDGVAVTYPESYRGDWNELRYKVATVNGIGNVPQLFADLEAIETGGISLSDLYRAERMDALVRQMRQMVDDNPEYGEAMVARWAAGLMVETGKQPWVVYKREHIVGMNVQRAMDGASLGTMVTNSALNVELAIPVPATEFGGIVITFASLKPDETLASQPHPILAGAWVGRNYVADEMALDPVPVTVRQVNADCQQADENTVLFYMGNNHLLRNYVNYGFTRNTDLTTVEAKTALWQLEVPMSVTPESVIYPTNLPQYPFADQLAEVCTYTIESVAQVATPMIFGPSPVEELAAIETEDVFNEN